MGNSHSKALFKFKCEEMNLESTLGIRTHIFSIKNFLSEPLSHSKSGFIFKWDLMLISTERERCWLICQTFLNDILKYLIYILIKAGLLVWQPTDILFQTQTGSQSYKQF